MNSNFLNLHDAALILTFVECLFLVGLLKVLPTTRKQSRQLLSAFFILIAAWVVSTLLSWNDELKVLWINTTLLSPLLITFSLLLQGPCLYLYFRSLSENLDFKNPHILLHLIPCTLAALAIILFKVDGVAWILKTPISPQKEAAARFAWTLIRCTPILYIVACLYVLRRLHEQLRQAYSSVSITEFKLAYFVLFGFSIHWLWAFFQYLAGNFLSEATNDWIGNFEDFLVVLLVNGLLILGLKNTRELLNLSQPEVIKNTEQAIDAAKIDLVEKAIHERKLYLENNINLDRFSEMTGLKPRELSQILHSHYKLNFFEFINGLRLEEAKRLLSSPEYSDLSILDIIYKSGFNSQSAFQRFFKRTIGSTPTEYRRQALANIKATSPASE